MSRGGSPGDRLHAAAAPVRVVRKPWQPATSNTARRFGSAPGTTSMQPPGVRPRPRGGRSSRRAATSTTSPRRFCAATSDGPVDLVEQRQPHVRGRPRHAGPSRPRGRGGRRAAAASSRCGGRSARCSDAAARTALSSASCDAGARGSSTTSGRESASEISLRSISPWPRATAGQWMREAGEPGRCSRRPSSSVSAAAISAARACAGVASPPPAAARTGYTRGSTSTSSPVVAGDHALGEPERVAQHERGRGEPAPPAAPERDLDAHARRPPARRGSARARAAAARRSSRAAAGAGRTSRGCGPRAAAPRARCGR